MPPMMAAMTTTPTTTPAAMPAVLDEPPLCLDAAEFDAVEVAACGSAAAVMVTTEVWPDEISLVTTVAAPEAGDAGAFDEEGVADDEDELESDEP